MTQGSKVAKLHRSRSESRTVRPGPVYVRSVVHDETHDGHDIVIGRNGRSKCRTCRRAAYREAYDQAHSGHNVIVGPTGQRHCRTCRRDGDDVDEIAVVRAVSGDPPDGLTLAEREAAILELRRYGRTYKQIAEQVGCSVWTAWCVCDEHGLTTARRREAS